MGEQLTARTLHAWEDLQDIPRYAEYESVPSHEAGDFNQVLLLPDSVVRVPYGEGIQARATVMYETELCIALNEHTPAPQLAIPKFMESYYDCSAPYSMSGRLPGSVLSHREVRALSLDERTALGRALGTFVAWYAGAISLETCNDLTSMANVKVPNRIDAIKSCARLVLDAYDIDETLGDVLLISREQLRQYEADGVLMPTIAGHDDLRPNNMTFINEGGVWRLHGVFDFGNTQPSSPERELRHAACLGRSVCEPAIEAYESLTGSPRLSEELLDFWAVAQASTVLANCLVMGHAKGIDSGRASMQTLRPGYDWSRAFVHKDG